MEPRREEQQKALEPNAGQKPKRFRIVKLEERIAPTSVQPMGLTKRGTTCATSYTCTYCNSSFSCIYTCVTCQNPGHCK